MTAYRLKSGNTKNQKEKGNKEMTKQEIYKEFGIDYNTKTQKIFAPVYGWIKPLLINGNDKLGRGVWTWSTLPTAKLIRYFENGVEKAEKGTCPCTCSGCYACSGCYTFNGTKYSLAKKTILARLHMDFVKRAITAQIIADKIKLCRIHAAGDFFNSQYIDMWRGIVKACPLCVFWSYTKNQDAEKAFDEFANCNIVKSVIPGIGFNFGPCEYVLKAYDALRAIGKNVYICRCGIDKNQHCTNCKGCSKNEFVLFIEHGTSYDAEKDPLFPVLRELIEKQPRV